MNASKSVKVVTTAVKVPEIGVEGEVSAEGEVEGKEEKLLELVSSNTLLAAKVRGRGIAGIATTE